jgi:hypothetical protein
MVRERGGLARAVVAACLLVCVVSLAACPKQAEAASRCVAYGRSVAGVRTSRLIDVTSLVLFYVTAEPEADLYWACSRKANRFVLVGREYGAGLGYGVSERLLKPVHLAGDWLIATDITMNAECGDGRYQDEPPCEPPGESLLVVDVARGLEARISAVNLLLSRGSAAPLSAVLVSATGTAAWLQTPAGAGASLLYGCVAAATKRQLACPPRLVAQGPIPAASLRLTGMKLSWSVAGQQQSSVF